MMDLMKIAEDATFLKCLLSMTDSFEWQSSLIAGSQRSYYFYLTLLGYGLHSGHTLRRSGMSK